MRVGSNDRLIGISIESDIITHLRVSLMVDRTLIGGDTEEKNLYANFLSNSLFIERTTTKIHDDIPPPPSPSNTLFFLVADPAILPNRLPQWQREEYRFSPSRGEEEEEGGKPHLNRDIKRKRARLSLSESLWCLHLSSFLPTDPSPNLWREGGGWDYIIRPWNIAFSLSFGFSEQRNEHDQTMMDISLLCSP